MIITSRSRFLSWFRWSLIIALVLLTPAHTVSAQEVHFTLPGINQQTVRLADFRGRWVVVNFWATWCTPCLLEMPELQEFYQTQHARVAVIGVNFDDLPADKIQAFVEQLGLSFPIALSGGQPVRGFDIKGLPTTFLVSPTGQLSDMHLGPVNAALLTKRLDDLEHAANNAH